MGGRQCVRRKRADVLGRRLRPVFYREQLPCGCERLCDARLRQQPHLRLQRQGASDGMRRRGWQVRRRWSVQRLHAGNSDLQRKRPSFVRLGWSVCAANSLRRRHPELRCEYREVRRVLGCVPVLGGLQRMPLRDMYEQHLRLRAEKPGNRVQLGNVQRHGRLPGVQSGYEGVQRKRRADLQQQRAVRRDCELRGTQARL